MEAGDDGKRAARPQVPAGCVVLSHEALFAPPAEVICDVCAAPVAQGISDDDDPGLPGEGVYLWTRGEEQRFERAPLCPQCASAIGVTALARWEIEEEEG